MTIKELYEEAKAEGKENKWERVWRDVPCDNCNGTGEIEVTNAEHIRQCDDMDMAYEIWCFIKDKEPNCLYQIEEWLKAPHT